VCFGCFFTRFARDAKNASGAEGAANLIPFANFSASDPHLHIRGECDAQRNFPRGSLQ
jgi:hypothetical protein